MGAQTSFQRPSSFVVQSSKDWNQQIGALLKTKSTVTKTVILPPGVELSDPRLAEGEVVEEKRYTLKAGDCGFWPEDNPFECDIDGTLLPPCWGTQGVTTHYAVYPNSRFTSSTCGLCDLSRRASSVGTGGGGGGGQSSAASSVTGQTKLAPPNTLGTEDL